MNKKLNYNQLVNIAKNSKTITRTINMTNTPDCTDKLIKRSKKFINKLQTKKSLD